MRGKDSGPWKKPQCLFQWGSFSSWCYVSALLASLAMAPRSNISLETSLLEKWTKLYNTSCCKLVGKHYTSVGSKFSKVLLTKQEKGMQQAMTDYSVSLNIQSVFTEELKEQTPCSEWYSEGILKLLCQLLWQLIQSLLGGHERTTPKFMWPYSTPSSPIPSCTPPPCPSISLLVFHASYHLYTLFTSTFHSPFTPCAQTMVMFSFRPFLARPLPHHAAFTLSQCSVCPSRWNCYKCSKI